MAIGAAFVLLVAYGWIAGGEQPLHEIAQPVPVPGAAL